MVNHTIKVLNAQELDDKTLQQVQGLLHLLNTGSGSIDASRVSSLIQEDKLALFVAEVQETIIGTLTLCTCSTLTQDKLWIEDVAVDECHRRQGIGRQLVKAAIEYAKKRNETATLYLTSNPTRKAARALYVSEGFEEYETGVFRMHIKKGD